MGTHCSCSTGWTGSRCEMKDIPPEYCTLSFLLISIFIINIIYIYYIFIIIEAVQVHIIFYLYYY